MTRFCLNFIYSISLMGVSSLFALDGSVGKPVGFSSLPYWASCAGISQHVLFAVAFNALEVLIYFATSIDQSYS